MSRVAITGWALRTPLGDTADAVVDRLLEGADTVEDAPRVCARLRSEPAPSRHRRFLKRMGLFALEVGHEAWAQCGAEARDERLGLYFGYGGLRAHWEDLVPALGGQALDGHDAWARGLRMLHPFWMLGHLSNNAHALFGIDVGARGDGLTVAGGNASASALASASDAIRCGLVDAAIVVGYDTLLEPETTFALRAQGIASSPPIYAFRAGSDASPRGVCLGEAAAAVVLEREDVAASRALAFVDAVDAADGELGWPRISTVETALTRLGVHGAPVVVDGLARGAVDLEDEERVMLARHVAVDTPLLSTASALGHLGGAASITQAIVLASLLRRGRLPRASTDAKVAIGLAAHPPGLVGAIRVEVP